MKNLSIKYFDLEALRKKVLHCRDCGLRQNRNKTVFGEGYSKALLMFIGEGPGCISGDSLIEVAYRDKEKYPKGIPIKELENKANFYVYSYDIKNKKLVLGKVKKVWKTGIKKIYKVSYEWIYNKKGKCTVRKNFIKVSSNHLFLRKLSKKQQNQPLYLSIDTGLKVGDGLQPFYRSKVHGYSIIGISSYKLIREARYLLEKKIKRKLRKKEQCHHKDKNKLNDNFNNLKLLSLKKHSQLHGFKDNCMFNSEVRKKHFRIVQSKEYREKLRKKMKSIFKDPIIYNNRLKQIEKSKPKIKKTLLKKYGEPLFYFNYLKTRKKLFNLSNLWLRKKFKEKFSEEIFPPTDNHKITSIKYIGKDFVYDMEIEKYNNFAVNNIFIHNSKENLTGKPFVGDSGRFLDDVFNELNLDRKKVYITNIVKCRSCINNIDYPPEQKEIDACKKYLREQLLIIKPKIIVTLGNIAKNLFLFESKGITQSHGCIYPFKPFTVIPTFHPSFILRTGGHNSSYKDAFKNDIEKAMRRCNK